MTSTNVITNHNIGITDHIAVKFAIVSRETLEKQ